jgi:hypothetical protein
MYRAISHIHLQRHEHVQRGFGPAAWVELVRLAARDDEHRRACGAPERPARSRHRCFGVNQLVFRFIGSSVVEWSQSSGILHEDLGTVEAPLDSIDSECEKVKQNFLENPSISKKERVERYVRLHTLGINDHVDLVPASSWTADKAKPKLIVKIEPPRCK